jgi:hypothetical protein
MTDTKIYTREQVKKLAEQKDIMTIIDSIWTLNRPKLKEDIAKEVIADVTETNELNRLNSLQATVLRSLCKRLQARCHDVWDSDTFARMEKEYNQEYNFKTKRKQQRRGNMFVIPYKNNNNEKTYIMTDRHRSCSFKDQDVEFPEFELRDLYYQAAPDADSFISLHKIKDKFGVYNCNTNNIVNVVSDRYQLIINKSLRM